LKLGAGVGFSLPSLDGVLDGVRATPPERLQLDTEYFDTPDLRLARWNCGLRFRHNEGWTVKLPSRTVDGGVLERPEILFSGEPFRVPEQARYLLMAYIRRASLRPVATLSTTRERVRLVDGHGRAVAEVVLDDVSVVDGLRVARRYRQLEIELGEAAEPQTLNRLQEHLRTAGAGEPETISKLAMALGDRLPLEPEVSLPEVPAGGSAADVIRAAVSASVLALFVNDPGVRLGDDPEAVHQARVATRRLRSQLLTFRTFLDPAWTDSTREELGWIARGLGVTRDRQVMALRLKSLEPQLPRDALEQAEALVSTLTNEAEEARGRLVLDMRSARYVDLLERLIQLAREPRLSLEAAWAPAASTLPLARKQWRRLRKAVRQLGDEPLPAELHRVRILSKQLRYTAEAVTPIAGRRAARFARAAARLQTVLGEHQDSITLQAWLANGDFRHRGFAAGASWEMERETAAAVRARWRSAWKSLKKRGRGWMVV